MPAPRLTSLGFPWRASPLSAPPTNPAPSSASSAADLSAAPPARPLGARSSSLRRPTHYMSKGSVPCVVLLLVLLRTALALRPSPTLASSWRLAGRQIGGGGGGVLLRQDPIGREPGLMSGHDELDGGGADPAREGEEDPPPLDGDSDGGGGQSNSSGELGSGGDVECPECGKGFKNDKSMFGHLRSHPNRRHKAAARPPRKLKPSPSPPPGGAGVSPPLSSPAPSSIDRPPAQRSRRDPQLTPLELLCACVMLTIRSRGAAQDRRQQAPPPTAAPVEEKQLDVTEPHHDVAEIVHRGGTRGLLVTRNTIAELKSSGPAAEPSNAGRPTEANIAGPAEVNNGELHGDPVVKVPKKRKRTVPKEGNESHNKKVKLKVKVSKPPKEKGPYKCKHCPVVFPSHQALGGHMAGHHKDKRNPVLNDGETSMAGAQGGVPAGGGERWRGGPRLATPSAGLNAAHYSMAVNQGLQFEQQASGGGHVGQHLDGSNGGRLPVMPASPPPPPPASDGDRRRVLNIDLNVEAPDQD